MASPSVGGAGRVQVYVRVRPQNSIEAGKGGQVNSALLLDPKLGEVEVMDASVISAGSQKRFTFDGVFAPDSQQEEVFEAIGRPTVDRVLAGYNGTVLAYGQTSSGKTHTMMGPGGGAAEALRSEQRGMTPRVLQHLMGTLGALPEAEVSWTVQLSVCELYNEELFDLGLGAGEEGVGELRIREDRTSGRGVYVENLKTVSVRTAEDALQAMMRAADRKHMGGTNANETSSRSHTIVQLLIEQVNNVDGGTKTSSQLFLVDLAGSERIDKTGAAGQRLKEAQNINLSLTLLGNVINKLTDGKALHVPYRDSKLTRLLQDSLGGNAMTTLLCACSPSTFNAAETLSTLMFANRAKKIENRPRANKILSDDELRKAYNKALDEIRNLQETLESYTKLAAHGNGGAAAPLTPSASGAGFRGATSISSAASAPSSAAAAADDQQKELRETIASLLNDLKISREENQRTDERAAKHEATIAFYVSREAELTAKIQEWKSKYEREKLACDSWARKFQQLLSGVKPSSSATATPQPTAPAAPAKAGNSKAPHSGPVRKTVAKPSAASAPSVAVSDDANALAKTSSMTAEDPDNTGGSASTAEEREMRALVRERMLLAQVDELRDKVYAALKYPIIIERLNKDLEMTRAENERKLEKQAQDYEALLQRQDREIGELQIKLDSRAAAQERLTSQQAGVGEEVSRLRAENDILHEENRANAKRLLEFATRSEKLQQDLSSVTSERDRLRRDIELSNLTDEQKTKLLGLQLAQQKSNFRRRLLECFSRDDSD